MCLSLLLITMDISLWGLPKGNEIILLQPPLKAEAAEILGFLEQTWFQPEQSWFQTWKKPDLNTVSQKHTCIVTWFMWKVFLMHLQKSFVTHWVSEASPSCRSCWCVSVTSRASQEGINKSAVPSPPNPGCPGFSWEGAYRVCLLNKLTSNQQH